MDWYGPGRAGPGQVGTSEGVAVGAAATGDAPTRADAQRERVVRASVEVFSRQGFRATSMNEIAAGVGLSKPTLYHYFRNKEELLVRMYSGVLDESLRQAERIVAGAVTPGEALRTLLAARVVYTCENQQLLKVCFEEEHELPATLAEQLLRRRRAFEDVVTGLVVAHLAEHPAVVLGMTPTVYANTCLGAVNWVYKWFRADGPATPAELGEQLAAALTAAIAP